MNKASVSERIQLIARNSAEGGNVRTRVKRRAVGV